MIIFQDVIKRIKIILLTETKKDKILDRDIANELTLDPQYFAVIKRRNKIPYEQLAFFCKEKKINMTWVLLEQEPQYLT